MLYDEIYKSVKHIPYGRVATYGQIAALSGNPRAARLVGQALSRCPYGDVPCHRVVNRYGGLCGSFEPLGKATHRALLELEGVCFTQAGLVDMEHYLWRQ